MSTVGVFSTMGVITSTMGGYHDACGGYHDYHGVMIPLKWRNSSRILSTSHFMIAILVSAFTVQ